MPKEENPTLVKLKENTTWAERLFYLPALVAHIDRELALAKGQGFDSRIEEVLKLQQKILEAERTIARQQTTIASAEQRSEHKSASALASMETLRAAKRSLEVHLNNPDADDGVFLTNLEILLDQVK